MGLPNPWGEEEGHWVVNLMCNRDQVVHSVLPDCFPSNTNLITIVLENVSAVDPFTMKDTGPIACRETREAMKTALSRNNNDIVQLSENTYVCYIDCSLKPQGYGDDTDTRKKNQ